VSFPKIISGRIGGAVQPGSEWRQWRQIVGTIVVAHQVGWRKQGSEDEHYDVDFWLNQQTGKLEVKDVKIHKAPLQENGAWTQISRYTFGDMDFDVTN
jgi:hypothetical protein